MANLIIDNSKKKLSELSTFRAEEESKRRAWEEEQMIDAMGQESEAKALPEVERYFKMQLEEENSYRDEAFMILTSLRKKPLKYNEFLEAVFMRFAAQEGLPKKYKYFAKGTKDGLVVGIAGTKYLSAFRSCKDPVYDYHACKIRAVQLGNTVAKLMGYTKQTEGGIILPDEEDLKILNGRTRKQVS